MATRVSSVGLLTTSTGSNVYAYPHHIDRASIEALPSKPGIYIFRDNKDRPLYIGKSINIRSRVLAHLRTPDEGRMLQQSCYVEFRRTAGDIGALLLESQLIKELQPLHNKKLRRMREMCTLRLDARAGKGILEVVFAREHDFAKTDNLYGLFATRKAALDKLRSIVETQELCSAMTGLETVVRGRACFARQIGRCRGACTGDESLEVHYQRLYAALQEMRITMWPFSGAVGIVEEYEGWKQIHVVDHWFYVGSMDNSGKDLIMPKRGKRSFDVDTYKILVRPLLHGEVRIEALTT